MNPAPLGTEAPPAAALPAYPGPAAASPGDPGFIGATSRERVPSHRRRTGVAPLGWLPWAALAALIALLALVTLVATRVGGDSDNVKSSAGSTSVAGRLTAGTRLAGSPSALGVTDAEGARQLAAQRGCISARAVHLSR